MNIKVELELRMDTASPNYSRSKGEQVKPCTNKEIHQYVLPNRLP